MRGVLIDVVVAMILCVMATGCGVVKTTFVDADGTEYRATVFAPPFGKIGEAAASMAYQWDGGRIAVGQDAAGMDNTGQTAAMEAIAAGVARGLAAYGTGGLSEAPGILSGVGSQGFQAPRVSVAPMLREPSAADMIAALEGMGYKVREPVGE